MSSTLIQVDYKGLLDEPGDFQRPSIQLFLRSPGSIPAEDKELYVGCFFAYKDAEIDVSITSSFPNIENFHRTEGENVSACFADCLRIIYNANIAVTDLTQDAKDLCITP